MARPLPQSCVEPCPQLQGLDPGRTCPAQPDQALAKPLAYSWNRPMDQKQPMEWPATARVDGRAKSMGTTQLDQITIAIVPNLFSYYI